MAAALSAVTRAAVRNPRLTLCLVLIASALAGGLALFGLDFKTQRADLIDPEAPFHRRWIRYTRSFGDANDVVVVVEDSSPAAIRAALDNLGARLNREPELFSQTLYKIDTGQLGRKALQFLTPEELQRGLERLAAWRPVLDGQWERLRLDALASRLRYQIAQRGADDNAGGGSDALLDHADRLTASLSAFLDEPGRFISPWPEVVPLRGRVAASEGDAVYLMNDRGTMGFLKVVPATDAGNFDGRTRALERLREVLAAVAAEHPSAKLGMTGIPVLENDEMRRSQSDMLRASLISFVGVGLILCIGFRGIRHPLLAMVMLAVGMAWTFGYTTLAVGHLNILSVSFAVILIGLGIDFAIHYLARYLELRHKGESLRPALRDTSTSVGAGILTAAATTALAFFCATLTQFLGVAELGIIAGGGILLCAVATFVVLPALVALADGSGEPRKLPTPFEGRGFTWLINRFPRTVMIASLVVIAGLSVQVLSVRDGGLAFDVEYDDNLLNLQASGLESVELQKRLFQNGGESLLFAVSIADSAEEARRLRQKFEALPTVARVEELASRLPTHSAEQTRLLMQAWRAELSRLPAQAPRLSNLNPAIVGRSLEELYLTTARNGHPIAQRIARRLNQFLDDFEALSVQTQAEFLNAFQVRAGAAILAQFQFLAGATDTQPLTAADLPPGLVSRYVSRDGKWLIQIFPKEQLWDEAPLARFVHDVRSVDPEVTGTPLQNYEASRQIRASYENASLYALAVVFLVLLVDFLSPSRKWLSLLPAVAVVGFGAALLQMRRVAIEPVVLAVALVALAAAIAAVLDFQNLRDALLAMAPPVGGGLLMFGILSLAGIDLNPANLIVLPLVLGIGVDDGVHVVHDFRMQLARGEQRYRISPSTMNAIVLTSLTSMIGFGSLMVAAHY
ncbi:MAG: MMPL family transporter [Planctomycetes bacterium]|nr:MMPL family transporter [Planctomycetota bacterium]